MFQVQKVSLRDIDGYPRIVRRLREEQVPPNLQNLRIGERKLVKEGRYYAYYLLRAE